MHRSNTLVTLLLCAVLVSSCTAIIPTVTHQITATPPIVEQPIIVQHRPFRVIQICLDTPPEYTPDLFHQAANKISEWIEAGITVNQDGFVVYVGEITSQSFQSNVLDPIHVPAIPADQPEPVLQPPYTPQPGENVYHAADVQATRDAVNDQAYTDWQNKLTSNHAAVAAALAKTQEATKQLRALEPTYDDKGADVWGCLADASQHFQNTPTAEHHLIIAATLTNTTAINRTPVTTLADASVQVIYRDCSQITAPQCAENDAWWKQTFIQLGARQESIAFSDIQQSALLPPLF